MKALFVVVLVVHGLIHFLGVAKALGLADLPQPTQPVSRVDGVVWLLAGLSVLATVGALLWAPRWWWIVGLAALALSQAAIVSSWSDAKLGTIVNIIVLAAVAFGFASQGPVSLRSEYRREVERRLSSPVSPELVTEADLEHLPDPVRRYLRVAGAVGQPRVHHVRAAWRGRIRAKADDPWMEFTAEQHNFPGEPARFFLMDARRSGLPVDVLHSYHADVATMRVRLLSAFPLVDARGSEMRQAETVTVLNDMSVFAPATLIDPRIRWEEIDTHRARARYTVGPCTVSAVLVFDDAGELVDFVSDDRLASVEGEALRHWRWSTPLSEYRSFGALRIASRGEGRWHAPEGDFAYIELELLELDINGEAPE